MASSPSLASTLSSSFFSPKFLPFSTSTSSSSSSLSIVSTTRVLKSCPRYKIENRKGTHQGLSVKALTLDFSGSFFEGGVGEDEPPTGSAISAAEDKEEPQCPPGLRQYETMAVLRPDMSEDERLNLTQKYEEVINY